MIPASIRVRLAGFLTVVLEDGVRYVVLPNGVAVSLSVAADLGRTALVRLGGEGSSCD